MLENMAGASLIWLIFAFILVQLWTAWLTPNCAQSPCSSIVPDGQSPLHEILFWICCLLIGQWVLWECIYSTLFIPSPKAVSCFWVPLGCSLVAVTAVGRSMQLLQCHKMEQSIIINKYLQVHAMQCLLQILPWQQCILVLDQLVFLKKSHHVGNYGAVIIYRLKMKQTLMKIENLL